MKPYFEQDGITIYHGEAMSVLSELPAASVDVLMTDPPYSSGGMFRSDRVGDPASKYRGWSQEADGSSRAPTAQYGSFGGDNKDQWAWLRWVTAWSGWRSGSCTQRVKPSCSRIGGSYQQRPTLCSSAGGRGADF